MVEAQLQLQLHVLKKRQSKTLLNGQIVQSDFFSSSPDEWRALEAVVQWHTRTVNTVLLESGSQKLDMLMQ